MDDPKGKDLVPLLQDLSQFVSAAPLHFSAGHANHPDQIINFFGGAEKLQELIDNQLKQQYGSQTKEAQRTSEHSTPTDGLLI